MEDVIKKYLGITKPLNYNDLLRCIDKLEKEDLKEYFYSWECDNEIEYNFCSLAFEIFESTMYFFVNLSLDPPMSIAKVNVETYENSEKKLKELLYNTINYIENLKQQTNG